MEHTQKARLTNTDMQDLAVYNNGQLAFFDDLKEVDATSKAILTEIYIIVLVREGKASLNINGVPYEAHTDDIFICTPNNVLENCLLSADFQCHCIGMSPEYVQKIVPMNDHTWDIKLLFEKHPLCSLNPDDATVFCQYYDLLCSKIHLPSAIQEKVIDTLMLALSYDMQNILGRVIHIHPRSYSSGEYLFKRFVGLLETSYPKSRNVASYAGRLHVTPKYLSAVCKKASGQTASALIDLYVQKDIEYLMKYSSKSIKEIANELEFPNLSFFGKYVKKHFGLSPKILRAVSHIE